MGYCHQPARMFWVQSSRRSSCRRAPVGADCWEISRFLASPAERSGNALIRVHRLLALALVEFALLNDIRTYSLIVEFNRVPALLSIGWDVRPLGLPTFWGSTAPSSSNHHWWRRTFVGATQAWNRRPSVELVCTFIVCRLTMRREVVRWRSKSAVRDRERSNGGRSLRLVNVVVQSLLSYRSARDRNTKKPDAELVRLASVLLQIRTMSERSFVS